MEVTWTLPPAGCLAPPPPAQEAECERLILSGPPEESSPGVCLAVCVCACLSVSVVEQNHPPTRSASF